MSQEIEGRVIKKLFQEFSRTESRVLSALSKLDECLKNPKSRVHSERVPETSRNPSRQNPEKQWGPRPEWFSSWSRIFPEPILTGITSRRVSVHYLKFWAAVSSMYEVDRSLLFSTNVCISRVCDQMCCMYSNLLISSTVGPVRQKFFKKQDLSSQLFSVKSIGEHVVFPPIKRTIHSEKLTKIVFWKNCPKLVKKRLVLS